MSLLDTLDGMVMMWAYGWALKNPARKLFYNLFLTMSSGLVALAVAAVEILGALGEHLALEGGFWDGVREVNDNFDVVSSLLPSPPFLSPLPLPFFSFPRWSPLSSCFSPVTLLP
jgi:high-affinity nickel-transport protein